MLRRWMPLLVLGCVLGWAESASAQMYMAPAAGAGPGIAPTPTAYPLNRFWYYPYYYFPHNYWPSQGPKWPEPVGAPYQPPPAYMAYPPCKEPFWRYEYGAPQNYYRGFHFWLDQF